MVRPGWLALLAGGLLLALGQSASAGDVIRLGGSVGGQTQTLALHDDEDVDTELVYYRGGYRGYGYGGYRGFYGGHRGFYGGYRGYGYGHGFRFAYRSPYFSVGFGYGRPFYGYRGYGYGGYGYGGYGYGGYANGSYASYYPSYYPSYYSYPSYCYPSYSSYYYPCSDDGSLTAEVRRINGGSTTYILPTPAENPDGVYRYDGGPATPPAVPAEPPALEPKRKALPREGIPVSLPGTAPRVAYPAYGEAPAPPRTTERATILVSTPTPAPSTPRVAFPAYGESR